MVIEKLYNKYPELHSIIEEALPNWMRISDTQANVNNGLYDDYYIGTENMKASILVYNMNGYPNGEGDKPALTIAAKNSGTNLNNTIDDEFGGTSYSGNVSTKVSAGLVRIISTEHAFGIVLMNSDRVIKTGAAVAYKGALNDGHFLAFIGNDFSGSTSSFSGPTTLIAQSMLDTVNRLRTTTVTYVNNYVLVPYCDWQHGFSEPVDDIYISYTVGSSGMPEILKDGEGNTYYRITTYYGSNYPTIYIKIKAE